MGRKTNSVSLRLKNTNRDYNHCWYGDILYADHFSKSLKVSHYLSQTLKIIDMPCPQTSVIGAFKKSNLLVCYLDPQKKTKLLEKLNGPNKATSFISSGQKKNQDSRALLKPLEGGLGKWFSKSLLLGKTLCHDETNMHGLNYALSFGAYKRKTRSEKFFIKSKSEQSISFLKNMEKSGSKGIFFGNGLKVLKGETLSPIFPLKKKTTGSNCLFQGSLGLDLSRRVLEKVYVPKQKNAETKMSLNTFNYKNKNKPCPYIFENSFETLKILSKFKDLEFFQVVPDKNQTSQNSPAALRGRLNFQKENIFGKQNHLGFSSTSFYCSEKLFFKIDSNVNYIKKEKQKHVDKKLFSAEKKSLENSSLNTLYGFYNGFSNFMENVVSLSFYKSTNETSNALFLADTVSYLLEKKVLFRSIKRQLLLELNQAKKGGQGAEETANNQKYAVPHKNSQSLVKEFGKFAVSKTFENKKRVTGIRISCSGRVGGRSKKAQRSRKDTFMWGETGLHVFSSKLDFAKTHAETSFGVVGVQVWVCTK